MSRTRPSIAGLLSGFLLAVPLFTAHAVDQTTTQSPAAHHKSHKKPAPVVLPPLPSGPLRQLPMDQIPAAAPRVTYQNGLLAISAQNAVLGDILREVHRLTGASIDVPPGGAGERVVAQLGPGAPRDVLALLLNGTSFNYVMLGSTTDPAVVASVMLSLRPSSGEGQTIANAAPVPYQPVQQPMLPGGRMPPQPFRQQVVSPNQPQPGGAAAAEDKEDADDADADDKDDDADQPQAPAVQPGQPAVVQPDPNAAVQPDQQATDPNQPNAGPRTPEQILQMMRQGQPTPPNVFPNGQPPQQEQ